MLGKFVIIDYETLKCFIYTKEFKQTVKSLKSI